MLGVPRLEQVVGLVETLAAGDVAAGLELLRSELRRRARTRPLLYQEIGRVLRLLLHLALAPSSRPGSPPTSAAALGRLARGLARGPLTRMLGLWLEHERPAAGRDQPRAGPRGGLPAPVPLAGGAAARGRS